MTPHRIAAGAVVIRDEKVLLVRYRDSAGGTYLVAPGGSAEHHESVAAAAVREAKEETGVVVESMHVIAVEDLICSRFKMCKVWFWCRYVSGEAGTTPEATREGIIEAGWFRREELDTETVYPSLLKEERWSALADGDRKAHALPIRTASF